MSAYYYPHEPQYVEPNSCQYTRELSSAGGYYDSEHRDYPQHHRHGSFGNYQGDEMYQSYETHGSYAGARHSASSYDSELSRSAYFDENDRRGYVSGSSPTTASSMSRHASNDGPTSATRRHSSIGSSSDERPYCEHVDCKDEYGRPTKFFSRTADVQRHMRSQHTAPSIDCPKPRCSRKGAQGFTRQDHCTEHQRQYHGANIPRRSGGSRRDSNGRHTT